MPDKPVVAQRTPGLVEVGPAETLMNNAGQGDKNAGRLGAGNSRDIEEYVLVNGRTIHSCAIT